MGIFNISNLLSFSRIPFALLFLSKSMTWRLIALSGSGLSDILDGYIARRFGTVTRFGAMLDPLMDKFFLFFVLGTLGSEGTLTLWQVGAFLSRDLFLLGFGFYLIISGEWRRTHFRSFIWGKLTTVAQYVGLFCIVIGIVLPIYVYAIFILLGVLFFVELFLVHRQII